MALNRRLPGKPAILRRLVAVFEQMRDTGKAAAFLRAYQKAVPDDPWAVSTPSTSARWGSRDSASHTRMLRPVMLVQWLWWSCAGIEGSAALLPDGPDRPLAGIFASDAKTRCDCERRR